MIVMARLERDEIHFGEQINVVASLLDSKAGLLIGVSILNTLYSESHLQTPAIHVWCGLQKRLQLLAWVNLDIGSGSSPYEFLVLQKLSQYLTQ